MIQPSRRGHSQASAAPGLRLHEQIAQARRRRLRLFSGGALACLVSSAAWLLGAPVFWHLGLVGVAFALPFAWPFHRARAWALAWIAQESGLAYQTALELGEDAERYGFRPAVLERAQAQAARLEPPHASAWWLPLVVAALLLAIVPVSPWHTTPRLLPFAAIPPADAASEEAAASEAEPEAEPLESAQAPQSADAIPESPAANAPPTLDDLASAGQGAPDSLSEQVANEDALSDFLDRLEDAPPPEREPQTNPFNSVAPQSGPNQQQGDPAEGAAEDGAEADGQGQSGDEEGEPGGEGEAGEQAENGESEGGSGGESDVPSGEDQPEGEGAPGESEEPSGGAPGESEATAPSPQAREELQQGESGAEAGNMSSAPAPLGESAGLEGPESDPELLQGRRNDGPTNLAGTVRLPSATEADALPTGPGSSGFQRSAEEAIQEGRIPLEYQEIIRNYFR